MFGTPEHMSTAVFSWEMIGDIVWRTDPIAQILRDNYRIREKRILKNQAWVEVEGISATQSWMEKAMSFLRGEKARQITLQLEIDRWIYFAEINTDYFLDRDKTSYHIQYERWTCGRDDDDLHRLMGPASSTIINGVPDETENGWWVRGASAQPFDRLISGEETWEQYFERHPESGFVLLELHDAGIIDIGEAMKENLQLMGSLCDTK